MKECFKDFGTLVIPNFKRDDKH